MDALPSSFLTSIATQLAKSRLMLAQQFASDQKATRYVTQHAQLLDSILTQCYQHVMQMHPQTEIACCVVAVGGYGRLELFPHSDIDVLILLENAHDLHQQDVATALLKLLWDLGLKTGHAVRDVGETIEQAGQNHTIAASLLDRRYICGNQPLFDDLSQQFEQMVRGHHNAAFIEAKWQERTNRHTRHGDSRFYLEPNIKENKGGLRDLHHLYWIASYAYGVPNIGGMVARGIWTAQDARSFRKAQIFLWRLRVHLHLIAGRPEERLSFDLQPLVAQAFGYVTQADASANAPVEAFMKHFFQVTKHVADLTRLFAAILEADYLHHPRIPTTRLQARLAEEENFQLLGSRLTFAPNANLQREPLLMLRLFQLSQLHDIGIHPQALHLVFRHLAYIDAAFRSQPQASEMFLDMLMHPKSAVTTLRELNESDILVRLIPEFAQIIGQMQYDRYHVYTVDEHTIRAIGMLHDIEQGEPVEELPLACELARHVESRRTLFVALLCHDIAKGSGGDHAVLGAHIARKVSVRLGLNAAETDSAAWLVEHQMLLSDHALRRDVNDPKTIADLVAAIQSPERLRLLLLLTVCDMRAVGPQVWNRWKGALLRDLFYRTEEAMGTNVLFATRTDVSAHKQAFIAAIGPALATRHAEQINALPDRFWADILSTHLHDITACLLDGWGRNTLFSLHHRLDVFQGVTHLSLFTDSQPTLLALVAGCMAAIDANIIHTKLLALPDQKTLLLLEIQNRQYGAFDDSRRLKKLHELLAATLPQANPAVLRPLIQAQQRAYKQSGSTDMVQVMIDNRSSHDFTRIELEGEDRIGFLYQICTALAELRLSIATAHITTYGQRAVDVFYVRDRYGLKITAPASLSFVRQHIIASFAAS